MTASESKDYPLVSGVLDVWVDRLDRPLASFEEYAALESALRIRDTRIADLESRVSQLIDENEALNDRNTLCAMRDSMFDVRDSRIRKLEELVLAIEADAGGDLFANCSDWFGVRDSLFS
jgi:hypothetical protein